MAFFELIASDLHEDWRKTRLNPNGTFEPRWKRIKDEKFVARVMQNKNNLKSNMRLTENGELEIDIANSTYFELSPDWQAENKAASRVVDKIIKQQVAGANLNEQQIGEIIHNEWLRRNTWAKGGELDVPFAQLPKVEQDKDLHQFHIGERLYFKKKSLK